MCACHCIKIVSEKSFEDDSSNGLFYSILFYSILIQIINLSLFCFFPVGVPFILKCGKGIVACILVGFQQKIVFLMSFTLNY